MKKGHRSRPRGVKARTPRCDQTSAHPSRKAREGWGTHCVVVPAERGATRLLAYHQTTPAHHH